MFPDPAIRSCSAAPASPAPTKFPDPLIRTATGDGPETKARIGALVENDLFVVRTSWPATTSTEINGKMFSCASRRTDGVVEIVYVTSIDPSILTASNPATGLTSSLIGP